MLKTEAVRCSFMEKAREKQKKNYGLIVETGGVAGATNGCVAMQLGEGMW